MVIHAELVELAGRPGYRERNGAPVGDLRGVKAAAVRLTNGYGGVGGTSKFESSLVLVVYFKLK